MLNAYRPLVVLLSILIVSASSAFAETTPVYRVNAGGSNYVDPLGRMWSADTGYFNTGGTYATTSAIAGTDMDTLYQSERYDAPALPAMRYTFALDPGQYVVRLHFAEIYGGAAAVGKRLFDVALEGTLVLDNFDIFAVAGFKTANVQEFTQSVTDGFLDIDFAHVAQNPKISAIEILLDTSPPASLEASPASLYLGGVGVGVTSPPASLMLKNVGGSNLIIDSLTLTGSHAGEFSVDSAALPITVAPDATTLVEVTLTPAGAGERTAALVVGSNDPAGDTAIPLSGTGTTGATLQVAPASLTFGDTPVGSTALGAAPIVLTNTGAGVLVVSAVAVTGVHASEFGASVPVLPLSLDPGESAEIDLSFTPAGIGLRTASLTVDSNDPNTPHISMLIGTGFEATTGTLYRINAGGAAYTDPAGDLWTADTGFFNTGNTYQTTAAISLTTRDPLYQTERNDPPAAPDMIYSLPVGNGTYRLRLHFAEIYGGAASIGARLFDVTVEGQLLLDNLDIFAEVGMRAALVKEFPVQVSDGSLDIRFWHNRQYPKISAIEVAVLGSSPQLGASPDPVSFAGTVVGTTSAPAILTLTNTGTGTLTINSLTPGGTHPTDFAVEVPVTPFVIAGGFSVHLDVTFSPSGTGSRVAFITVSSNDPDGDTLVQLVGQGVAAGLDPDLSASPNPIDFGDVTLGMSSVPTTLTLTNTGGSDLTVSSLSVDGTHANDFAVDSPATPFVIPTGNSVDASVTFTPSGFGTRGAELTIASNDPSGETAVALSGHGTGQPALDLSTSSITFPDTAVGATSRYTLVISNEGGDDLVISSLSLSGTHAAEFAPTSPPLPITVPPGDSADVEIAFTPGGLAWRTAQLSVGSNDPAGPALVSLQGAAYLTGSNVLYRVNGGGPNYTDPNGNLWTADTGFYNTGSSYSTSKTIALTAFDALYQKERYDPVGDPEMVYSFPVGGGTYIVRLHFAEIYAGAYFAGARYFDVFCEGQRKLDNLDIYAEVGPNAALIKSFEVDVNDGLLDILFVHQKQNPKVSAIEIERVGRLVADTSVVDWSHVQVGQSGGVRQIALTNDTSATLTISSIAFLVNEGSAQDFEATLDGSAYTGDDADLVHFTSVPIDSAQTLNVPVDFNPTQEMSNDAWLEFRGNFETVRVRLLGTGQASGGHPFLHVVINAPPYAVDYDGDAVETVTLDGSFSHTHQFGHTLTTFEWRESGQLFATTDVTTVDFPLGSHTVSLTIYDDNAPPETLSGSATIQVVTPDAVPGALLLYYNGGAPGATALLDAVPATPNFAEVATALRVVDQNGQIGGSGLSTNVMVRMLAQVDIAQADTYTFQATGGEDRRLFLGGVAVTGPVALAAGRYDLEARFAVAHVGQLPAGVTYARGAGAQLPVDGALITHDETDVAPVINSMPTSGPEAGGQAVTIGGFGFFPADQVEVHWGNTVLGVGALTVLPGSIGLTTPPGTGTVSVSVETPQGLSNAIAYTYTQSGAAPVDFTLSDIVTLGAPTRATWGPDGRLYVGSITGAITALTFDDNYDVTATQAITALQGLSNNNILGIACSPFDGPGPVRLYVAHNELFANGGACFTGFSPYSGQISVLTGPDFSVIQPLITGLPVSNHDHGINGIEFDAFGDMLFCSGGNTNAGVVHCNIGGLPESPLTAAILRAHLGRPNFNGEVIYLETATGLPNDDQVYGGIVDVAPGVDLSVFGAGFRNPFDLLLTTRGILYNTDNGPNAPFGAASTSATTQGSSPDDSDELNLLEVGRYFGHPNRNRGRYDDRQNVYHGSSELPVNGNFTQVMTKFSPSTNGLLEYRANTFGGAMRGDLLAQQWNGTTYRVTLSPSGRAVDTKLSLPVNLECLDIVTAPGGALIGVDYTDNKLVLALPVDPATGLNVFDIHPWRALSTGGTPFVIGGKGFGSLADTQVTIGGIPAQVTSVSSTRIRGIVPAHLQPGPRLLDVSVTVGAQSQVLPKAFQYVIAQAPDTGSQAWASISPNGTLIGASTYTSGSFKVTNTSTGNQNIERVLFDLSTGAFPDNVFDPNATAGDPVGKGFTVDTSTGVGLVSHDYLSPRDGGFDQLEIVFNAFEPGDSLTFSTDIDPTSIKGAPQPGPGESGSVGGIELIGARVTIHFNDGTVRVGEIYRTPDSVTGAHADIEFDLPVQAGLEAIGHAERQVTVTNTSQTMRVAGTPGTAFSLMRMEGALYTAGAVGGGYDIDPYEANTALAIEELTGVIGPGGFTNVPVVLTKNNSLAGYNYFRAALKDDLGRTGPCSPVVVMYVQP